MIIELVDYDPTWTDFFEKEKGLIRKVLPENATIEHIGSTAIGGRDTFYSETI
jgi:GrpB-like predicted nucleotidyltransferase (UPF0157 family)